MILDTILLLLSALTGFWLVALGLCSLPWIQRHIWYAHKAPISRGQQLDKPETFGFLRNQVISHIIETSDGQRLYAWLVLPLKVYLKNDTLLMQPGSTEEARSTALRLLEQDPQSRLVVYFHGNAGTIGQTRRTEAYRSITAGDSDHIYVLAFDYRGFGKSTGFPTESGLIDDAVSVLQWAMIKAQIPASRIVLVSQSLGTAVASGAVAHFAGKTPPIEFGGLLMCAPFTDAAEVFLSYSVFGSIPLMAPLEYISWLREWFRRQIRDSWKTADRIQSIITNAKTLRLTMVHAMNDEIVPWRMTNVLSDVAVDFLKDREIDHEKTVDLAEGGSIQEWTSGSTTFRKVILHHGGHNTIMKWNAVAFEVAKMFQSETATERSRELSTHVE